MIFLKAELFEGLDTLAGVKKALQQAIELEHATIPAYLFAMYSLKKGTNNEIRQLILSVVMEEMLHMSLACNMLNAIGGEPVIDRPDFIPSYPGPLPGSVEEGLIVSLAPFSLDLIKNVFMVIEEPEQPLAFQDALTAGTTKKTIGEFYNAIKHQLKLLGNGIFIGDPSKQVTSPAFADLIAVTNLDDAIKAIDTIITQGEGTPTSPLDCDNHLAHYYRYAEIYHGKKLISTGQQDVPPDEQYVYGGEPIPFEPTGVAPFQENPKASDYTPGTNARYACDTFNYTYTSLLKSLHNVFNGHREQLNAAIGLMESLKLQILNMAEIQVADGHVAAPSFEYLPVLPA